MVAFFGFGRMTRMTLSPPARSFPPMSGFGSTRSAALDALQDALDTAIQWMEEEGEDIPVPHQLREYKGNISLRTTPEKHRELAVQSAEAGVSLNRYINSRL